MFIRGWKRSDAVALLQPCLRQHRQKLPLGSHVDGLRDQLTLAVVYETLRYAFHLESLVHFPARIEQYDTVTVTDRRFPDCGGGASPRTP